MAATNTKKGVGVDIPDDLAFSILSKLPLKSLKRFTCVQKSWSLLFENPRFMNMFRSDFISKHHSLYDDTCLLLQKRTWGISFGDTLYMLSSERFDFEDRVRLDWPPPFQGDSHSDMSIRNLLVLNGSVAFMCEYNKTTYFHIWILGELGVKKSWTKLFIVGPFACVMYPISAWKNGNIFFRKNKDKDGKLVWFDLSTQGIVEIGVKGEWFQQSVIYKKNLLLIEGMNN